MWTIFIHAGIIFQKPGMPWNAHLHGKTVEEKQIIDRAKCIDSAWSCKVTQPINETR
jgi:hypothetical protein